MEIFVMMILTNREKSRDVNDLSLGIMQPWDFLKVKVMYKIKWSWLILYDLVQFLHSM